MTENYKEVVMDLVDDIKAISTNAGLGGEAGEYNLVTQSFLYKFLNDKFLYEAKKVDDNYDSKTLSAMSKDDYEFLLIMMGNDAATLKPNQLIDALFQQQNEDGFYKIFDQTLNDISVENNDIYSVHTAGNASIRLFEENLIADIVRDPAQRDEVAKQIISK